MKRDRQLNLHINFTRRSSQTAKQSASIIAQIFLPRRDRFQWNQFVKGIVKVVKLIHHHIFLPQGYTKFIVLPPTMRVSKTEIHGCKNVSVEEMTERGRVHVD